MLDSAFEALKKFDWGSDLAALNPIEDAVIAAHDKPEIGADLEKRMIAALKEPLTRDAQDYICRKLAVIGTAASVSVLAGLLVKKENSHMARFALERNSAAEAGAALRDALGKVSGDQKIGVITSLGSRGDAASVSALAALLNDSDAAIARAAATSLGTIGTTESAKSLQAALANSKVKASVIDALLNCAECLLAGQKRAEASDIYKSLNRDGQPRLVRLAAMRGLLASSEQHA